jgi:hypothetical protein
VAGFRKVRADFRLSLVYAVVCALVPAAGAAQRPTVLSLKAPSGILPAEFTGIGMIRELANGRVIVLDTAEKRVYVADFESGTAELVSRTGDGPQEYRRPTALFPLSADSSLIVDVEQRRWILLVGERPVATVPPQSPVIAGGGYQLRGVDARGRAVMLYLPRDLNRPADQGDSLYLVRLARSTGRGDTLTRVRSPFGGPPGSASKNTPELEPAAVPIRPGAVRQYMMAPAISDQAIAFPDGWIAIARVAPYRVDWIDNAGRMRRGAPLPVPVTKLDDAEKRAYLARLSTLDGAAAGEPGDIRNWIPAIPPFWGFNGSLFTAPDGRLLIARARTAALPNPTYDLVDRDGVYRGQLALKQNERVVGFGLRSVYVSVTDADGIERLRRHPYPWP